MGHDIVLKQEIRSAILAGIVLTIHSARRQGNADPQFIAGILAASEHQAITHGLNYTAILDDARIVLGAPFAQLIDMALQLERGTLIGDRS